MKKLFWILFGVTIIMGFIIFQYVNQHNNIFEHKTDSKLKDAQLLIQKDEEQIEDFMEKEEGRESVESVEKNNENSLKMEIKEFHVDTENLDVEEKIEVVYKNILNEEFIVVKGEEDDNSKTIKKWLKAISPDDFSDDNISNLIVYKMSDEIGILKLAFIAPNVLNSEKYDIYVNSATLGENKNILISTIIHEFAHMVTLNHYQVNKEIEGAEECQSYLAQEGCARNNSYINSFYQEFWEGKFNVYDGAEVNYNKSPDSFVTKYSATNPGEDIAESFVKFIFEEKKDETIASKKINFFYSYRWLRDIRNSIHLNIF